MQRVGVNGATSGATANLGLRQWNPTRYASLDLTAGGTVLDDSQSFDVYTQIAQLAKGTSRRNPLADLRLSTVYAAGAGTVLGGIRLPDVEVPVALNDGINSPANLDNPLNAFCVLSDARHRHVV